MNPGKNSNQTNRPPSLKNKLRSLQRLLNREKNPGLPRPAAHGKVRLLRKLEAAAKVQDIESKEKRYSELYHRVKFFERRKAERRLKKAQKNLTDLQNKDKKEEISTNETLLEEEYTREVKRCEEDVVYVKWFPKHIKYVSLYPSRITSKDEQLDIRRAALRRWTLINAEANMFIPTPPSQDVTVNFGEEDDEEAIREEDEGEVKGEGEVKEDEEINYTELHAKATDPFSSSLSSSSFSSSSSSLLKKNNKRKRVDNNTIEIKLPSRPVAPALVGGGTRRKEGDTIHETVDFEDDAAVAAAEQGKGGSIGISHDDPFFSHLPTDSDATLGPPVFIETGPDDIDPFGSNDQEDGNWRSSSSFKGQRTSAARYEREKLGADSKRYRDSAATANTNRDVVQHTSVQSSYSHDTSASTAEPNTTTRLQGLLGRKLKRAERALKFEQSRGGSGGAVLGVGGLNKTVAKSYDEAFFGTIKDQGAKLKHQERIKVADRREIAKEEKRLNTLGRSVTTKGIESSRFLPINHAVPKRLASTIANAGSNSRLVFD